MIEPTALPLATNYNKVNIIDPHESVDSPFNRGFRFQQTSSITKMLTDFEDHEVVDENTLRDPLRLGSKNDNLQATDDLAILKAELEDTRRKLAEYEARSRVGSPSSKAPKDSPPSGPPFANSPTRNLGRNEATWPEYSLSIPNVPPPPRPTPLQFPYSVPPLRLPSGSIPFVPSSDTKTILGKSN